MPSKGKYVTIPDRILQLLDDGEPHLRNEILEIIETPVNDDNRDSMYCHIYQARKKLPEGHAIICRFLKRQLHYQRVILYRSYPIKS